MCIDGKGGDARAGHAIAVQRDQKLSAQLGKHRAVVIEHAERRAVRRQQAHRCVAETSVEFEPEHFQQMAGLVCYYNAAKFHYFYLCRDEAHGKHLRVMSALPDQPSADAFTEPVPVEFEGPVELRAEICQDVLRFGWRRPGGEWKLLPQSFDASILSDEATGPGLPNFTGAFMGMACQDLSGAGRVADFGWFEYRED